MTITLLKGVGSMLYFAYGSNLDYIRMTNRCKECEVIGQATLEGYRLVFMENNNKRVVANIVKAKKYDTQGVLYDVTANDLRNLDKFEGYPYIYARTKINVCVKGENKEAITYIMDRKCEVYSASSVQVFTRQYGAPKRDYFQYILNGYNMYGLSQNKLMESYLYSKDKNRNSGRNKKMKKVNIFVYGTLKKGFSNHKLIERAKYIGDSKIDNFDIFKVGYRGSFPAIVKGEGEVFGEIYELPFSNLKTVDRLEGYEGKKCSNNLYDRELIKVKMCDKIIDAYVYIWNKNRDLPDESEKLLNRF